MNLFGVIENSNDLNGVIAEELPKYIVLSDGNDKFRFGINSSGHFVVDYYDSEWKTIFEA